MILKDVYPSATRNGFVAILKHVKGNETWFSDVFIPADTPIRNYDRPLTPLMVALAVKNGYIKICLDKSGEYVKTQDSLIEKLRDAALTNTKKKTIKSKRLRRNIRV